MYERSSTAFRAAVLLTIFAAACNDSPLAPPHEPSQPGGMTPSQPGVRVFAGWLADSVVHAFDAVWASGSHPDYREARHEWRKANGISDSVGDRGFTPVPVMPNAFLTDDEGSLRPPPQILSHYEALHFGQVDRYVNVPDGVEGDVTFIGDQADISASSITITKKDGSTFPYSGEITRGPGVIISCADVLFGSCDNRRRLNGVMILSRAPTCDASGSGTVSYYVANLNSPLSGTVGTVSSGSSGNNPTSIAAAGVVSSTASPCPAGGQQSSDSTSASPTGPVGVPSGPPPPPTGPNAPYYPPTSGGTTSTYFHCEQGDFYVNGSLFETTIVCYPS
jgi:hypothetical protein